MVLRWILAALLQVSIASPGGHILPPSGLYLSYLLTNDSSYSPLREDLVPESLTKPQRNISCINGEHSKTAEYGVICLWNGIGQDPETIVQDYEEFKKIMFPSESHLVDYTWHLQCFTGVNATQITCSIQYVTQDKPMTMEFTPQLYYARDEKGEDKMAADCRCHGHERCECSLSPVTHSYILWMEMVPPASSLRSPPVRLLTAAIIKLDPPSDLRVEITRDGKLKVLWSSMAPSSPSVQCQVKRYVNTTEETSPPSYAVVEKTYVILDVPQSCSPLVFEVRCRKFPEIGIWSNWSPSMVFKSQDGYYFPQTAVVSSGSSASFFCMYCDKNKKIPSTAITWGLNLVEQIPSRRYTAVSDYVGKVTIDSLNTTTPKGKFQFDALYCCVHGIECQPRYAEIYVIDTNISITCETNAKITFMTCRWIPKQIIPLKDITLNFRYYVEMDYSNETRIKYDASAVKSCDLQPDGYYKCVFNPIQTVHSYHMWVEIQHPSGTLRSPPVSLKPLNVVKPNAPPMVQAKMMADTKQDTGCLLVTWGRPRPALQDIFYQLRYRVRGQEAEWQVKDIYIKSANITGVDVCRAYTIQVRCQLVNVSRTWSDWTNAIDTVVTDIKEPLRGPEFWRIMTKNKIQKGDNITLVWKPLQKEESLCSIRGYEIVQQVSNIISWSTYVGNVTNYTLTLQDSVVTLTIRAVNSLGHSKMNHNLTLSKDTSTVKAVQSLNVYALNSTVLAVWTMSPVSYDILGFVLEWRNLRGRSQLRWTYIPPNVSRYYIEDQFYAIEKYQFSLTPVFLEGVGSPHTTYEFSKGDTDEMQNNTGLYIILPAITATSFLLVITLAISHQRMKRLFWKEVPNPKYCSWAQGVNFQKPDTLENLFMKHQHPARNFPFVIEPEAIFENLNIDEGWGKEDVDNASTIIEPFTDDHDSACTTGHFSSSCTYADEPEISMYAESSRESSVKYATIISNPQPSKQGLNERKISVSSGDGCFLRNNSIVVGNLEDKKKAFLIMAGLHAKEPKMTSSNSTVSSEGFSEPTDQEESFEGDSPERNLFYLGLDSNQNNEQDNYFSKNPLVAYHIQENMSYQELDYRREMSSKLIENDYGHPGFLKRTLRPYMPQFQNRSPDDTEVFDMCT